MAGYVETPKFQIWKEADDSLRVVDKETGTITNFQPRDRQYQKFLEIYRKHGGE